MNGLRLAFFSLNLALVAGCGWAPPKAVQLQHLPDVPDGYANVYFMRERAYAAQRRDINQWPDFGQRVWPAVLLNGQRAAPLPEGTFSVVAVKPGSYAVTMKKEQLFSFRWTGKTNITVQGGQSYYLELELKDRIVTSVVEVNRGGDPCMSGRTCGPVESDFDESAGQIWRVVDTKTALDELQWLLYVEPFSARLP